MGKTLKMDYDAIYDVMKEKKLTAKGVSVACGKSSGWLGVAKHNESTMIEPLAKLLANVLEVEMESILYSGKKVDVVDYAGLKAAIEQLAQKVDMLTEAVNIQQDDILSILAGTNKIASAVAIANALLQANGRCKEYRYKEACSKRGIGTEEMRRALDDVGAHYQIIGKGPQAVRWIVKERLGS